MALTKGMPLAFQDKEIKRYKLRLDMIVYKKSTLTSFNNSSALYLTQSLKSVYNDIAMPSFAA